MDNNLKTLQEAHKSLSKELKDLRTQFRENFDQISKRLTETEEKLVSLENRFGDKNEDSIMTLLRQIEKNTTKRIH